MATVVSLVEAERLYAEDELWLTAWEEILRNEGARRLLPEMAAAPVPAREAVRDEVEELRRVLLRSGLAGIENPTYNVLTIRSPAKKGIQALNKDLIDRHGSELKEMAAVLSSRLTP